MRFSLSWLEEIFKTEFSAKVLEEQLSLLGLEVDAIEPIEPSFNGLKAALIKEVSPHPDANRLSIATVFDGTQELQIVCGATNCKKGLLTALAPIDSELKNEQGESYKIKKGKLRGVESFGMLTSAKEMGLSDDNDGIIELPSSFRPGEELAPFFRDTILNISFTPNLGHAMSVLGIARELSCLLKIPFAFKDYPTKEDRGLKTSSKVSLKVSDGKNCLKYGCRLIEGVEVKPSPLWLQQKLKGSGIRPINNIVDATNLVLHEMGHPLHAFDYDRIEGKEIQVQSFEKALSFKTLDGVERHAPPQTLFICDAKKPIALAGIMGGENSQIHEKTSNVLLEVAQFNPSHIRKTSRALGLSTEASKHFERGVDPCAISAVLDRVSGLILEIAGGTLYKGIVGFNLSDYEKRELIVRPDFIRDVLGAKVTTKEMVDILERLEFSPKLNSKKEIKVIIPSYRNDVHKEIDLVEEIGRFYGFQKIAEKKTLFSTSTLADSALFTFEKKAHEALRQEGLQEILTCDLISPDMASLHDSKEIELSALNYVSIDQSVLRTSLLANHLQIVKHNQDHQQNNLHLYEIGKRYFKKGECFEEETRVAITLTGLQSPFHYDRPKEGVDFFILKGIIENLLRKLFVQGISFSKGDHKFLHPGIQADLIYEETPFGYLGEIHPTLLRKLDIKQRVFYAELSLPSLMALSSPLDKIQELPIFPSSERDWTLTCLDDLEVGHLIAFISSLDSRLLKTVSLQGLYRSDQLGAHLKNVTLCFVYRNDKKTLSFEAAEIEHARIMNEVLQKMKNLIIQPI